MGRESWRHLPTYLIFNSISQGSEDTFYEDEEGFWGTMTKVTLYTFHECLGHKHEQVFVTFFQ